MSLSLFSLFSYLYIFLSHLSPHTSHLSHVTNCGLQEPGGNTSPVPLPTPITKPLPSPGGVTSGLAQRKSLPVYYLSPSLPSPLHFTHFTHFTPPHFTHVITSLASSLHSHYFTHVTSLTLHSTHPPEGSTATEE